MSVHIFNIIPLRDNGLKLASYKKSHKLLNKETILIKKRKEKEKRGKNKKHFFSNMNHQSSQFIFNNKPLGVFDD